MQNRATAYNRHALVQAERAQARKHGTLWGGGSGLRSQAGLSPHARAGGPPQSQLTVLGSPAEATGGGQRKCLVSRGRELTQERNAQPASEGKGESTFRPARRGAPGAEARPGKVALLPSATRRQQKAPHLLHSSPRVTQESNLAEAVFLYHFLLDLLLHPLTSPSEGSADVQSSPREAEPRGLDICLCRWRSPDRSG